nr:hypothetical protein [Tanacetum cinerariifolium]
MPPKRTSTSAAPAMTQAAIKQLVIDSITAALEAQAANMANADNTNRNPKPREAPVARNYVNEKINLEDVYFQEIINPDFDKIDSPFQQTSSLKPYVSNVILEKIIINLEDEVVNLLEKEKVNLETIESLKSKGVESSETVSSESENQSENDCLVVKKEYDKEENPKVIAPGMFKLNVSQCVSPVSMSKSSCDSNNVEIKLKGKRSKRKSSKENVKQVDNDVSRANNDFVH